jgi:hypothetical protein
MFNYATPDGSVGTVASVDSSINTDTYRGYPSGVTMLGSALSSLATSSLCGDLVTAEGALTQFWSDPNSFSNVNQWRSVGSHGPPGPGQIQIGGTVFFYDPTAHASHGRPTRRKTPVIVLPPGKPHPEDEIE